MPIQHNIKIAGETYTNIDSLQMNGANSEEGKTIEYICPEWDNLSFNDTTPILGSHTTDKDGFKTVTIESDDLKSANIIESATIFGVEGAIPINEDADITVHGNRLTVPAGYYPNMTARTVDNGTLTVTKDFDVDTGKFTASAKVTKNGYLTSADNTSTEIQLDTTDAKTIYPSTSEQIAVPANRYTLGEIKVAAMPEGKLADIELNNNNGKIEASLSISKPGYVDNTDRKTAELTLPSAQLAWNIGTAPGGCEAKITKPNDLRTVNADYDGDYYTIKATAIGNDGEAGLDATEFTAGYLSTNPIEGSSYVRVPVASDNVGKEIHIPKATLSANGATVSVTEAGYLPEGIEAYVQQGDVAVPNTTIETTVSLNTTKTSKGYKVTASGSKTIAPEVQEGYIENGSAGTVTAQGETYIPEATFSTVNNTTKVSNAGYIPAGATVGTVDPVTRAQTNLTYSTDLNKTTLTFTASNDQKTGYVTENDEKDTKTSTVTQSVNGKTVTAMVNGVETISKSVADGVLGVGINVYKTPSCSAKITAGEGLTTISKPSSGTEGTDYYSVKATATGNSGEAIPNITLTPGYLSKAPEQTSGTNITVSSDTTGKTIYIPRATLGVSGKTVSVTGAGYLPKDVSQSVNDGAYSAEATAAAVASVSAANGNITVQEQSSQTAASAGYYFKVSGTAKATATAKAKIDTAGYLPTGNKSQQDTDSHEATKYYTIATSSREDITPTSARQEITPEDGTLLSKVTIGPIPDNYAQITGYNYDITSAGQHNIRNYNYATVAEGKVEINDDTIEFNAIVNEDVQTGDYGRPYYKIEVQQGSENTSVSATVTQSGYVTAGEEVDSTPLTVNVSGAVFQSQIADPRPATDTDADATIGYQQEIQIGAGYYPYSRIIKNGVEPTTRAQTTIGVSAYDASDKMTVSAANNQTTGYVIANPTTDKTSIDIQLTQGTPSINSSTGVISATATMASGTKQVSQSKTLSLNTKGSTIIAPATTELTAVEAGVYTTGEIKVAAMPEGTLKTPYSTVYDSGLIITSYGVDTAGYLDASNKTSSKQLTTVKQYEYMPTTYDQSIVKGQWIDSAITIKGDPDLQPDNIKEGATIFGVTGTYTAVQDYKLSGLWTFDETRLIAYAPSEPITQEIDFYIHAGSGGYGSSITAEYNISYGAQLTYNNTLAYSQSVGIHTTQKGWQGQNFSGTPDTIEFTSEQYVSAKFYNWFTSVATQASGICTLQASGYPTSAYLFYYNGASSVSMAEVNPGASDIAVPCDRIYIIGSVQCSLYSGITTLTPIVTDIGDVKIQEFNIPLTLSDATLYINY